MSERPIGDVIARMSPSRLDVAQKCLAQFRFRYVEPDDRNMPKAWRMMFGSAMDDAANGVYGVKLQTHETPSAKDAAERFAAAWDYNSTVVDDWEGSTKGDVLDIGTKGAALWRDEIAQHVQPLKEPQLHVEREIVDPRTQERWTLHGFLDLYGEVGGQEQTIDLKTSGKRYSASAFAGSSQPAAYTTLTGQQTFSYHVVTSTKHPATQVLTAKVSESHQTAYLVRAGMLRRQIRNAYMTGDWLPNRQHMTCSKRYCDQWQRCVAEYGGEVKA